MVLVLSLGIPLIALVIVDQVITVSARRRRSWTFHDIWDQYVYGPLFVLLCLGQAAYATWGPDPAPHADRVFRGVAFVVLAVFIGIFWFRFHRGRRRRGREAAADPTAGGSSKR
jgi:hypothetical protein